MKQNQWLVLAGFVVLCLAVGGVSGAITANAVTTWYPTLNKPFFNPPPWIFAPVWTLLYIMMAVAAWRVWLMGEVSKPALNLFFIQLALNFFWSVIFFQLQSPGWALIEIAALWLMILLTTRAFWHIARTAAYLMLPYLAWVSFASVLNASIWWLN
ncbi:MAG: tryptophan-rich sensory protein [Alphaproteobacteria bacterium]|nr:tryptophan-rich sensory protein [Alphaproteobacteria bacterium]